MDAGDAEHAVPLGLLVIDSSLDYSRQQNVYFVRHISEFSSFMSYKHWFVLRYSQLAACASTAATTIEILQHELFTYRPTMCQAIPYQRGMSHSLTIPRLSFLC